MHGQVVCQSRERVRARLKSGDEKDAALRDDVLGAQQLVRTRPLLGFKILNFFAETRPYSLTL